LTSKNRKNKRIKDANRKILTEEKPEEKKSVNAVEEPPKPTIQQPNEEVAKPKPIVQAPSHVEELKIEEGMMELKMEGEYEKEALFEEILPENLIIIFSDNAINEWTKLNLNAELLDNNFNKFLRRNK
jgi:hypothetical protein